MKTDWAALPILLCALGLAFTPSAWSQGAETAEQHLKWAESYRDLAEFARQDIADYKKAKESYARHSGSSASTQIEASLKEYDELIAEDEALLADFKILQEWHRRRAKELQGEARKKVKNGLDSTV